MSSGEHSLIARLRPFAWIGALVAIVSLAHAGDEDMSPSAYHVFDPETGYMMTVDPQAEEQIGAQEDALRNPSKRGERGSDEATGDAVMSERWIYSAGIAILFVAILAWTVIRRRSLR